MNLNFPCILSGYKDKSLRKFKQGTSRITNLIFDDYWGKPMAEPTSHKSYRPLTVLSFRLNVTLFGPGSLSFHAVNILLHLLMIDRLYRYLVDIIEPEIAFYSSLIFAVHPIHSEAVANCVGRAEIISSHLVLSAIQNRDRPLYSGIYTFLAMMSKETGVMCLAILVALEIIALFREVDKNTKVEERLWDLVTSKIFIWLGFFIMFTSIRFLVLQGTMPTFKQADNPAAFAPTQFSRLATKMYYWFQHYWLLFCPARLAYDWAFGTIPVISGFEDGRIYYVIGYVIINVVLALWALHSLLTYSPKLSNLFGILKFRKTTYADYVAILLLLLPFVPCLNLFFIVGFAVAERVMYIPSIGFSILVVHGAFSLTKVLGSKVKYTLWLTFLLFGAKNAFRNNGTLFLLSEFARLPELTFSNDCLSIISVF